MALTDKQRLFVHEYLVDLNATQAAIRAGYSEDTARSIGCENLTKPDIAKAIEELMAARADELQVTQRQVLNIIIETIERCRQAKPVLDRYGAPIMTELPNGELAPAYEFDSGGVLKGAELLGKYKKMWTDKVQHSGDKENPIMIEKPTPEQITDLLAIARGQIPTSGE